jgi:hypothetical protein
MSSVTFSTTVGGDGSTVTDDDNATTGLGNGGALIRLVPMMQQVVNVAAYTVNAVDSVTGLNDLYLGSYSSNPTLNNSGDALIAGNLYFNDVSDEMRVYTGSAWVAAYIPAGSYLPLAGGTMTGNLTLDAYTEKVATLATSGTIALNPSTGTTLSCAAAGTVTFTDSLSSGQSISLLLTNGSSYTINWPTTTWVTAAGNTAPTLSASNTLVFWKISSTLYGALVGKSA